MKGEWFELARDRGQLLDRGYVGGKGRLIFVLQLPAAFRDGFQARGRMEHNALSRVVLNSFSAVRRWSIWVKRSGMSALCHSAEHSRLRFLPLFNANLLSL